MPGEAGAERRPLYISADATRETPFTQVQMSTPSKRWSKAISVRNPQFLCRKIQCWLAAPSSARHTPPAARSILTPHSSKAVVPEDAEPPSRSGILPLKGDIYKYGNTTGRCTHAENVFYLFTAAQCPVHFIHYISYLLTSLSPCSSPEKAVYIVSRKSRIQFIVIIWQDLHDEKTLYQFCH